MLSLCCHPTGIRGADGWKPLRASQPHAPELKPEQITSIGRFVMDEMGRENVPGVEVGVYNRGQFYLPRAMDWPTSSSMSQ
jgi:hypothetical protein